jgi:beta-barrel assembly-enhancing protease
MGREDDMRRFALSIVGIMLLAVAGCTTNPVTGKSQLDLMGEAQEIEMGKAYYPGAIQGSLGPLDDAALQGVVTRVGGAVAAVGHRPALPYAFTAVNDPQVNAFALPGGKICITRGLLSRLESEDGLAAVLGHEVGHVTARHAVAAYNRQMLANVLLIGGGIYMEAKNVRNRELIGLGAVIGAQLALAHYSREQERQSDEIGLDYAVKAGYSPRGMIETQRVLLALQKSQPNAVEKLFASHPMSAERLAKAEERVGKLPAEVRDRPLKAEPYKVAVKHVVAERPAWDAVSEGLALLSNDKHREGEAKLAEAVRLVPKTGVVRSFHAAGLAAVDRDKDAVSEGVEGARLSPGIFVSRLIAGELLIKGDPQLALQHLAAAEQLMAGNARVAYLAGVAYERLNRRQEAGEAYRTAVERDPNGEVGAAALKRLRALGFMPDAGP